MQGEGEDDDERFGEGRRLVDWACEQQVAVCGGEGGGEEWDYGCVGYVEGEEEG